MFLVAVAPFFPPASNKLPCGVGQFDRTAMVTVPSLFGVGFSYDIVISEIYVDSSRHMFFQVKLALQGACGSCPSSTTTMKMGIERVLNENFLNMGGVSNTSVHKVACCTVC